MDENLYIKRLHRSNPLREPAVKNALQRLKLPESSRGLDAGCGIGLQAVTLARDVGPEGHITGLDICKEFLDEAKKTIEKRHLTKRITLIQSDINSLPFGANSFDWLWSSDSAFYPSGDPLSLIKEFSRVVKPGGIIAILAWTSQQLLPGYPLLEARLNSTFSGIAPFHIDMKPENHYLRTYGWFTRSGIEGIDVATIAGDAHAPLGSEMRDALLDLIEMRWKDVETVLGGSDLRLFKKLTDPGSTDFILDLPDYYAFFTYSLFYGRAPE